VGHNAEPNLPGARRDGTNGSTNEERINEWGQLISTREQLPEIPWDDIIGMRHRLVHAYAANELESGRANTGHQGSTVIFPTGHLACEP